MRTLTECMELRGALLSLFSAAYPGIDVSRVADCRIEFNPRMRSALGRAWYHENRIELNSTVLSKYPEKFDSTFAHELAHLLAYVAFNDDGHGDAWKKTMQVLGYPAERCHRIPVEKRTHRVMAYASCGCRQDIPLKTRRFKAMQKGERYKCKLCGDPLKLHGNKGLYCP